MANRVENDMEPTGPATAMSGLYRLKLIFPTQFKGNGFLVRDGTRDYTKLQEGAPCPLLRVPS